MPLEPNNSDLPSAENNFGRGFSMALLNINSLVAHIDELRVFTSTNNIDILAINETKIYSTINDFEISLPGYGIVRKD